MTALILDWNGTVVDDLSRAVAATAAVVPACDVTVPAFRDRFRLPLHEFFAGLGVPESGISEAVAAWNREMAARTTTLAPGARQLLTLARDAGAGVHIVSGADAGLVRADAAALGVAGCIDTVTGSAHPKRDRIGELRQAARTALYVGDTDYDIREGSAAGAVTAGTTYGYQPADVLHRAGAHVVVRQLTDLLPLLGLVSPAVPG
jgi:phosphoglycolate phosphatase-like HAD superfamily hydrolase